MFTFTTCAYFKVLSLDNPTPIKSNYGQSFVGFVICFVILYRTQRTWLGTKLPLRYKNVIKIRFKHDEFMALEVNVAQQISFYVIIFEI